MVLAVVVPATSEAQDRSHWGVVGSFAPTQSWNAIPKVAEYLFANEGTAEVKGADFTIGISRGRELGGDWGVSFVHRTLKDGSRFESETERCTSTLNPNGSFNESCSTALASLFLTRGVTFSGVEVHKYLPFVTIRQKVQVGMNVAGGIGRFDGDLERHEYGQEFVLVGRNVVSRDTETVTTEPARDFPSVSPFPLGKVEAAVAVLAAPGLKIRGSGGFSFPGYRAFTITGLYFFGAR